MSVTQTSIITFWVQKSIVTLISGSESVHTTLHNLSRKFYCKGPKESHSHRINTFSVVIENHFEEENSVPVLRSNILGTWKTCRELSWIWCLRKAVHIWSDPQRLLTALNCLEFHFHLHCNLELRVQYTIYTNKFMIYDDSILIIHVLRWKKITNWHHILQRT